MSKTMKQTFKLTALAAALLAVYGSAHAQGIVLDPNTVAIGAGSWSNFRPQNGQFDGMRDSGLYGLVDIDLQKRDDATGTWLGFKSRYLGLDDREMKVDWLRQGDIGASLEFSRIPRDNPFTFNTGLQGIGSTVMRVVNIAPGTGQNVELGTVRDRYTAKFYKNLANGLVFNASFRNETKEGTRNWGRGGAPEFLVDPIDSTIRIYEGTLTYSRDRFQLSGGYYGTSYDTSNTLVTSYGTITNTGNTTFYTSLPLDNQSHEIFLNGGYDFSPTTRATFKTSYSRATQNEALPTAAVPGLASPFAPYTLDGKLDTTLLEAGITARPMQQLSVSGTLRYRDFNDKTPTMGIVYAGANPTVYNTPFSYTNKTGKIEANYRLPDSYSLLGGVEYFSQDRSVPYVGTTWVPFLSTLNETTLRAGIRKSMSETVNGSLTYMYSDRHGSTYVLPSNPVGEPNQQTINPMNIANRKRDKVRAMLDWSPMDQVSIQFAVDDARDNYDGPNPYGLQDGSARLYSVDASFQFNSSWNIHTWISHDVTRANEVTKNGTATKINDLIENGDSFGFGVNGKIAQKIKVGGNLEQFRSVNQYNQYDSGPAVPPANISAPPPDITNTLLRLRLFTQVPVEKNAEVRVDLIREKWSTNDWTWMMYPNGVAGAPTPFSYCGGGSGGVGNCTTNPTDGTTVTTKSNQNSTFVGVRYIYRFQ